jgi:hypothetical protein
MLLASCSKKPEYVYVDRVVKQYPPQAYLVKCDKPTIKGDTWKAVGALAIERGNALDDCADKIDGIIEWSNKEEGAK